MKSDQTTFKMDKCFVLFVLLLVPYSTMSQDYVINLTSEGTIVTITSPNFPTNYRKNDDTLWQVIAPTGFRVIVQFNNFKVRSGDLLSVYHGLTNSLEHAEFRTDLSGSSLPENISSIGSYLWLRFTTDHRRTEKGFSLLVRAVKPVIINLTSEETTMNITSTNYPENYVNNVDILWQVISPTGFRVMVQFKDFDLEPQGTDGTYYNSLRVYHSLSNSLEDATQRALLSGSFLPDNITSIGFYLWLWFTTDGSQTEKGFSLSIRAVELDWACDFKEDTCGLIINEGSWINGEQANYYYIEADERGSSFTIPHVFTSVEGSLSFGLYQESSDFGYLNVTVCKSQDPSSFTIPLGLVEDLYGYIDYNCSGIQDIEVKFTKLGSQRTSIRVFDIQLYEISGPTTASPSTVGTQTTPLPGTLPESTQPMDKSTQGSGGSTSSLIPALSSTIVLILIIIVIITVFVFMRRRFRDPKVTEPVDQEDDHPNLYNNPVYCSKDDGLPVPDLIISTNSRSGSLSQARHPSTCMDNQYEEFEGDRHPVTNADGSVANHDALRDTTPESNTLNSTPYYTLKIPSDQGENSKTLDEGDYHTYEQAKGPHTSKKLGKINKGQTGTDDVYQELNNTPLSIDPYSSLASPNSGLPKTELQNGGKHGQSDGPAVLDDQEEYNALTFNQSSDITRAMKKPTSGGENVSNGYGVLDLPEQKDSKLFVNSPQLHNDDVYNTLNGGPQEQQNGKQQAADLSSGYQALKLGQSNIPISHQVLNHKMGSTDDGSTVGYQSLSPGTKGPGPKAGSYEGDQSGDESEYHSYQDPSQMNQDGSADTPTEQDDFSSDKYNVLHSGKEVGDYHVYQATDDTGVDEGNYEDLDRKMSREDEYSEIDQSQNHAPGTADKAPFEPIYSDEVYSEFQGN